MHPYPISFLIGGDPIGHEGLLRLYEAQKAGKGLVYLEGLASEGNDYGVILCAREVWCRITACCEISATRQSQYCQLSVARGYAGAYREIHGLYRFKNVHELLNQGYKAWKTPIEAHKQGVMDIRILGTLLDDITRGKYKPTVEDLILAGFRDDIEMKLHYCNLLVRHDHPCGYRAMSRFYLYGPFKVNVTKALRILEEAEALGFLDYKTYKDYLLPGYR